MIRFFKRLFCKHQWEKIAWRNEYDGCRNKKCKEVWYECKKCGKIKYVTTIYHKNRIDHRQ